MAEQAIVDELKDQMFDAVRRAFVGDGPWFVGPAHLGIEVTPEAAALDPANARRIARIHEAVCEVIDDYQIEDARGDL